MMMASRKDWPSQPWYPLLLQRCTAEDQIELGHARDCTRNYPVEATPELQLKAWRVRPALR